MLRIIHNAIPEHMRRAVCQSFPGQDWHWWYRYQNGKLASVDPYRVPSACTAALHLLASAIAPPAGFWDYELHGAGLHFMPVGTSLGLHLDATHHPNKPWRRVASLVYFLESCEGGELVVEGQTVFPVAGDAALFSAHQWHQVLTTRSDRRTLSLFAWEYDPTEKHSTTATFAGAVT